MLGFLRVAVLGAALIGSPGAAQTSRAFPPSALRGQIVVTAPPELALNGQPARLAPAARIRGQDNMIVLSGTLVGQKLAVHYTLDGTGEVRDVWILRADELARQPWPVTPQQAATWVFDPVAQVWSRP